MFLGLALWLTLLLERSYLVQSDEGYTLNGAWQLWNGMRMYDDFRQFVAPGSSYSVYLLWRLVGSPSYLAARLWSLAFSFSATTALYWALRRAGVRGTNLAFSMVLWLSASSLNVALNHNSFSSFAAVWFLLAFLRAVRQPGVGDAPRTIDCVLLGASAGLVLLFLQTKGLFLAGAAGIFFLLIGWRRRAFRPLAAVAAGFAVVVAPLLAIWRPAVLVREWFLVPISGHYLRHTDASVALAVVVVAGTGAMAWLAIRLEDRRLQVLAATQAALVGCMSHNLELHHLAINCFPAIVFVSIVIRERLGGAVRGQVSSEAALAIAAAGFAAFVLVTPAGRNFLESSTLYADLLGHESRTLFLSPRVAQAHAIYAGPFLPGLYFELHKKNPYFVSETVVCDQACQQRLIGELSTVKPEMAFLDYDLVRHLHYDPESPVDVYLRQRYVPCPRPYYGEILVRAVDASWCP